MFGFVNVVGATLRETTRTADTSAARAGKPAKAPVKPAKAAA